MNSDELSVSFKENFTKKDVLQDWDYDETDLSLAKETNKKVNFLSAVQDTVNQIAQDSLSSTTEEHDIEFLLKELLADDSNSTSKEHLFEEMLSKFLGKELLYPPLNELYLEYPKWLQTHRKSCPDPSCLIANIDKCRFENQYSLLHTLISMWDKNKPSNDTETSTGSSTTIQAVDDEAIELLIKIQDCGCPPDELIKAIGGDPAFFNSHLPEEIASPESGCNVQNTPPECSII